MPYRVGPKGQVVIPKDIRERLGVRAGWLTLQRLVDDYVEVYFVPPEHDTSLKSSLPKHIRATVRPGEEWDRARQEAWKRAAKAKVAGWSAAT